MTKDQLIIENTALKSQVTSLNNKLHGLLKILNGKKSEKLKLTAEDINQLSLFAALQDNLETEKTKEEKEETVAVPAHTRNKKKGGGRKPLPDDLERVEEIIRPEDYSADTHIEIGIDVTELLEYDPARLWVRKIIRPKYIIKGDKDTHVENAKPLTSN